jgi:hypothetical protein
LRLHFEIAGDMQGCKQSAHTGANRHARVQAIARTVQAIGKQGCKQSAHTVQAIGTQVRMQLQAIGMQTAKN